MEIIQKNNEENGVFIAQENGKFMGELTYVWSGTNKFIIDHTGVEPAFEGQGVGKALFMKTIAFAREQQLKIIPLCPFAARLFSRMEEELKDVKY
jgi:predicted GNAT family acetyltransferase